MARKLPVIHYGEARFECVFPTCGGICCRNGRPGVEPAEALRIAANLDRLVPRAREAVRPLLRDGRWLTRRVKDGCRMLAVVDEWCVFHNDGCILHRLGALEGEAFRYKPWRCVAFPLDTTPTGEWYVRQWGNRGEAWDLFCLDPAESKVAAEKSLEAEQAFVRELDGGREAWRFADSGTGKPCGARR